MATLNDPWKMTHKVPSLCPQYTDQSTAQSPDQSTDQSTHALFSYDTTSALPNTILGFGGAFTEAASLNFQTLSEGGRTRVVELLFGKGGLGYSLGRTHINSCDFSVGSYNFDDEDGDFELKAFGGVQEKDGLTIMPFVRLAMSALKAGWGEDLKLVASPWSPPPWMKGPSREEERKGLEHATDMLGSRGGTCLRDGVGVGSKYADVWARYMSKWVSEYENSGIPIWAITTQNEPEFAAPWEACSFNTSTSLAFVTNFLGPTFRREHEGVKILGFDHNKDHAPTWAQELGDADGNLDGIGYHWYAGGMDRLLDGGVGTPNLHKLRSLSGSRTVLGTEGCHCPATGYTGGDVDVAWKRAERNAHAMLADLAAGSEGSIEWNLVLDKVGGPNHLGNVCDGPIVAMPDRAKAEPAMERLPAFEKAGEGKDIVGDGLSLDSLVHHGGVKKDMELGVLTQPMYWVAGHFTRYLREGSRATKGIVEGRRAFATSRGRGGDNNNARVGFEATFFPCEGSSRQQFVYDGKKGEVKTRDYSKEGRGGYVCLGGRNDEGGFGGVLLVKCDENLDKGEDPVSGKFYIREDTKVIQERGGGSCLGLKELDGEGHAIGVRGGSQLVLEECRESSSSMVYDKKRGEMREEGLDVCLTTGWPFLQGGSFINKDGDTVLVILNEAEAEVGVVIQNGNMLLSLDGHSIATVVVAK
ncbi:hypothetical protein TrCOL_g12668 [Triparma columacea]|uniref:Glucosylceramidase n=1 Tax=Triparma columacea TaxID=722753 RepID=A0A9W7GHQ0_9STRA|nr:hypothetical protein TrCOL_g12668 [Triparma columacea]